MLSTTTRAPAARATAIRAREVDDVEHRVGWRLDPDECRRLEPPPGAQQESAPAGRRARARRAPAAFAELLRDAEVGARWATTFAPGGSSSRMAAAGGEPRRKGDATAVLERAQGILERLPAGVAVAAVHRLAAVVIRRGGDDRRVQRRGRSPRGTSGDHGDRLGMEWLIGHGSRAVSRAGARRAGPSAARWRPRRRRSGRAPAPRPASPARPATAAARRTRCSPDARPEGRAGHVPDRDAVLAHRLAAQRRGVAVVQHDRHQPAARARLALGSTPSRPTNGPLLRWTVKPSPASSGVCSRCMSTPAKR